MSQRENGRSSSSRGDLANRLLYSGAGSAAKKGMMGRGGGGAGISGGGFRLQKKQQPSVSAPMMDGAVPKESGNIFGRTTTIAAPPAPKWPGIKGNGELLSEAALRSDEQSVGVGLAVAHVGLASDASIAPPHIGSIRPPGSSSENSRASRESSAMKLEGITPRKPALPSPPASASAAAKMGDRGRPHASSLLERLKLDPLWRDPFSDPSVFLYLKPISRNPYSLCIVGAADAQVPGASFYTLSANGLVLSRDGRTTFLTLEQFEREYYVYHKIASLPFFRSYPKWKSFVEWKGHVRARKRARCVARLEESLFILNPPLRSGLLQLMSLKHDVSKLKLFKAHLAEVQLQEFCTVQASQRAVVGAALSEFLANVRSAVLQACDNSLAEFLESAGFALPSMGAQFNIRDALLRIVEDLTPSEMSFTERAAVRTQCRRLAKFIRVVDCIVADTHLSLALSSTCSFVAAMLARSSRIPTANLQGLGPFRSLEPEKDDGCSADSNFSSSSPPSVPMFQLSVSTAALAEDLEGGKNSPRSHRGYLSIEPPEVTFHVDMEASLFESLTIVRYPPCLLWDPAFRAFVQPLTDDGTFSEHCDVKRDLESAIMVNPDFLRALEDAHVAVERAYRYCLEFVACFEPLIAKARSNADFLRNVTIDSFVGASVQDLSMILQQHSLEVKDFKRIKLSQDLGLVKLSTGRLESLLRPSAERCLGGIHRLVPELFSRKQEELLTSFTSSYDVLRFPLRSVEGFIDLTRSLRRIKREWRDTEESWDFLRQLQAAMESAALQMSDELKMQTSMTKKMRDQLLAKVEEVDDHYDADLRNYSTALTRQIDGLAPKMAHIMLELGHGMLDNPDASIQQVLQHLENCEVQVSKLVAHADQLQEWASVLKMDAIDREGLEEVCEEMRRKARLWRGLDSFQNKHRQWLRSQWHDLDVGDIESEISRFWHIVQLSERQLASNPVVGLFRDKVKQVKDAMPVIANLRSDSLQERHRAAIDALIGIDVSQRTRMSFQEVLQRNLQDVSDEIAAIATEAEQEATLLRGLKKVEDVWEDMEFTIIPHKSREECRVLGSVELVTDQLDDSLVAISNILASPYVSPIRAKVEDVHGLLLHFDKTLDEWLKLQKTWMHLEAIFSAPDIQKQLANEWGVVSSVDAFWRELMRRAATIRICLKVGAIPCIYDNISKHNLELEGVAKGLAEFIKLKRQAFPRFYFLSDEELLQLLSSCRDPQAIQPHLEKCFEGIHSLRFGEGVFSTSILAMVSREGEEVPLGPNLKARGAIEEWLTAVDDSAKSGLRRLVKASLSELRAATTGDDRACWLLSGIPAMVSQCCSAVEWSERVERVLSQVGSSDKQAALESIKSDCEGDLISVIDRINGDLSPLQRLTAVAHVTQRVHVRDVTQMLIDQSVDSASSFQWQAQVRLYWDDQSSSVLAHHSNFSIPCGYEYQGAVPRLIVTPLTERCWLTITGALSARLGANPIGPAGTGKTESTKDLARTLGMQCIVFNCSEQVDCGTMSHLLRGVAQSGAWICLDEFNRIDIEVLSVIGQQLMIIRQARLAGADEMMFEGQLLVLKEHHVIATMNPGYEGRTELPNNLKACYRPVAMMVPDYTLIAEVILLSEGFKDAQTLSTKVTALASLCSEQLSRQPHYDFGMRAVKNVLLLGGECKRCQPDLLESTILMRALRSSTAPKLLGMDVPLFDAILCDLFPNQSRTEAGNSALRMCIRGAVEASRGSLQEIPAQVAKVEQLNETLQARMGVALVGEEGTGKTTCYEILACALKGLRDARRSSTVREKWSAIQTQVLNPKVVTAGDLFGRYNEYTHEWRDGIASFLIRRAVEATANDDDVCQWIVFDGPIDTLWVENLNSVLDDNAVLCLASGERMKLNPGRIRLLFEVMSLDAASPATVSRLGVVFIPLSRPPPLQEVFSSWLAGDRLLECLEGEGMEPGAASILRRRLAFLAERVAIPLIVEMDRRREVYAEAVPAGPVQRISSACSLFEGLLSQLRRLYAMAGILQVQRSEGPRPALPFYLSEAVCDQAFIFSITWGLGGGLLGDHALAFDVFLRDLLTGDGLRGCVTLPPAGSVFDYYIHFSSQGRAYEWRPWSSAAPRLTHLPTDSLHEVMIPTGITAAYSYLVETSMAVQRPVFVTGHGGVGKTMLLRNLLRRRSKDHTAGPLESLVNSMGIKPGPGTEELSTCTATESWRSISSHLGGTSEWLSRDLLPFRAHPVLVALSARTSSTSLQRTLEDRMVHARGGGLTPPAGRITAIFVDDVNMPAPDSYGTQPPLELLRQAMSCGGFYDLESKSFRSIQGATYLVAAASGGGARTLPSPRLTRLFTILCVPEPDRPAMETVFNTIIMAHLGTKEFASEVTALGMAVVSATLDVYIKVAREFLPTPTHPHYTFDLRDVSKVMAGMLLAKAQSVGSEQALARLWLHESCRVFGDLLMDDCDRQSLHHAIIQALGTHFKLTGAGWTREELFELTPGGTSTPLLFGDLFGSGSVASDRLYEECGDIPRMVRQLNFHKEEYNLCALSAPDSSRRARSTPSMDLVFFPEAVSHLLRISRVLRQARGHALLLGLAGSGRESLSRMSASMAGAHWFGFNQSYGLCKFQEQLKKAMLSAGLESCSVTLFVRDSDVADEAVLEDLNCLINSGEVPGLFSAEEEAEIVGNLREAVRASGKPDTPENCRLFFAARVVSRLHVIMCMDPHDPSFRRRVRDFPGIVSCCTVDWYDPWSRSALHAVATRVLAGRVNEHDVGRACAEIHETAVKMASEYCTQLERNLCITPQTFFNFLHSLLRALDTRRCTWQERLDILGAGVVKLAETNNVVQKLRLELTGLQPQLEEKAEEVDHLLERLSTENREAVEAQARVASEEDAVFRQQSLVAALQKEAQKDLDAALPVLEEAMKSLDSLRREDITEIKSFTSPPEAVRTVMESVCLLLDEDQDWDSAKRVLGRPSFMEELRSYEKNQVSPSTRKSLKRFTQNEGMSVERLRHVSLAAAGLCMWVHAMDDYTEVYEVVKPKMQRVSELNEQLLEANRKLVQTRAEFSAVEAAVESLKCKSDAALADKVRIC
jgi:dynein heavy chain